MYLDDFDFNLPAELIARYPLVKRSASRLLYLDAKIDKIYHHQFHDVVDLINPGDLLVFNDTRVIPARLYGKKLTGGQVEVLVERILDTQRILAQIRVSKPPRLGEQLLFTNEIRLEVKHRNNQFYELVYNNTDRTILEVVEAIGQIPLPPYLHRSPELSDYERYQTIYAKHKGSVAAPTAGLHFDDELLTKLHDKNIDFGYLTLHIGAGTFLPVRAIDITQHKMHAEYIQVSNELCKKIINTKANGQRVIAVGTTSLRALETACQQGTIASYQGETDIFIYPGYSFRCIDALITNFHLPRSSLLMLVCALGGYEQVMRAYRAAIDQNYRFYSYGDAMLVDGAIPINDIYKKLNCGTNIA